MKNPFFSVIMPVYNRATFLRESISSVLDQTFQNFELVCVDDGSTDHSVEVINEFARLDSRVKLVDLQTNRGRCAARNAGIDAAQSDWICFLDSDDNYLPNHLQVINELIIRNGQVCAFATEQTFTGILKNYKRERYRKPSCMLGLNDLITYNPISLNQLCFKKELGLLFVDRNLPVSEDWLFMRELALKTGILKVNVVTNNVNEHDERTVKSTDWKLFAKYNEEGSLLFVERNRLPSKIRNKVLAYTYLLCANILLSNCYKADSFPYLRKALGFSNSYLDPLLYKALIKIAVK